VIGKISEHSRAGGSRGALEEFPAVDHDILLRVIQKVA
jgi:hypothetical protein